jgi:hypothetical protein
LESLLAARASTARGHAWALREDPGYLAEVLSEYKDHHPTNVDIVDGIKDILSNPDAKAQLWQEVVLDVIDTAHGDLETWSATLSCFQAVRRALKTDVQPITPGQPLPDNAHLLLSDFNGYLVQLKQDLVHRFRCKIVPSPDIRTLVTIGSRPGIDSVILERSGVKLNRSQKDVLCMLRILTGADRDLDEIGLPNVVDELGRLLECDNVAKNMVSNLVADLIGDLAIVGECERQYWLYYESVAPINQNTFDEFGRAATEQESRQDLQDKVQLRTQLSKNPAAVEQIALLGTPSDGKYNYPIDKRRTEADVNAMRAAESRLDALWAAVDKQIRASMGDKLRGTTLGDLLAKSMVVQRTAAYVAPAPSPIKTMNGEHIPSVETPLSKLSLGPVRDGTTGRDVLKNASLTAKYKTRGSSTAMDDTSLPTDTVQTSIPFKSSP